MAGKDRHVRLRVEIVERIGAGGCRRCEHEVWWANYQRQQEAQQKKASAEFFAKGEAVPDLDMWPINAARHEAAAACRHTTPPAAPCADCQRIADRMEYVLIALLDEQGL